jgi:protein gp37
MADGTKISWATTSWNPITGCSPISEGCLNCYAKKMAKRLQASGKGGYDKGFEPTLHEDKLTMPSRWKTSRTIFVCSMGDLFHEDVPFRWIEDVFYKIMLGSHHTFLLLTKRPERMRGFFEHTKSLYWTPNMHECVWLGVTAENQKRWDERVPVLLSIPAAHRWVNIGPMLERIRVEKHVHALDWVALEGESGSGARHMEVDWARDVLHQCDVANVPFHLKQFSGFRPEKCPMLDGHRFTAMPPFKKGVK